MKKPWSVYKVVAVEVQRLTFSQRNHNIKNKNGVKIITNFQIYKIGMLGIG